MNYDDERKEEMKNTEQGGFFGCCFCEDDEREREKIKSGETKSVI